MIQKEDGMKLDNIYNLTNYKLGLQLLGLEKVCAKTFPCHVHRVLKNWHASLK